MAKVVKNNVPVCYKHASSHVSTVALFDYRCMAVAEILASRPLEDHNIKVNARFALTQSREGAERAAADHGGQGSDGERDAAGTPAGPHLRRHRRQAGEPEPQGTQGVP